jgi:hypothetical protein
MSVLDSIERAVRLADRSPQLARDLDPPTRPAWQRRQQGRSGDVSWTLSDGIVIRYSGIRPRTLMIEVPGPNLHGSKTIEVDRVIGDERRELIRTALKDARRRRANPPALER